MADPLQMIRIIVSGVLVIASTGICAVLLGKSLQMACNWRRIEKPPLGRSIGIVLLLGAVYALMLLIQLFWVWVDRGSVGPFGKVIVGALVLPAIAASLGILAKMLRVSLREGVLIYLAMIPPSVVVGILLMVLYAVSAMPALAAVTPPTWKS